jgi:hypothetical protein
MLFVYLGNKILDLTDIKFKQTENTLEKALSSYTYYNYTQTLTTLEMCVYLGIYSGLMIIRGKGKNPKINKDLCSVLALPYSLYNTYNYIKTPNKKIIDL